jgi:hypothetical protein
MTNAELEVIEVAFIRPLEQTAIQTSGTSRVILPITPDLRDNIASKHPHQLFPHG